MSALSAARGVSQVMNRCEDAKVSGFLDLSDCELLYLADAMYMVLTGFQIKRCSLRNNKLKKFPVKLVDKFPDMDVLNLEGNQITELPEAVGKLCRLRGINVAKNRLTAFPEALTKCPLLALVDLSGNMIEELDVELLRSKMPALKQIHIKDNPISANPAFQQACDLMESIKIVYK